MPRTGAGSTRGRASRRGRRDLTRFVLWHSFLDSSGGRFRPTQLQYWQVWEDALDLTQSGGSGTVDCYFHYTTQLGFQNITAESKKAVEVFVLHSVANQHVMMSCDMCLFARSPWRPPQTDLSQSIWRPRWSQEVRRQMRGGEKAGPVMIVMHARPWFCSCCISITTDTTWAFASPSAAVHSRLLKCFVSLWMGDVLGPLCPLQTILMRSI